MNSKKWALALLSVTLAIVTAFGALTYCLDPLLQYGPDRGILTYRHYSELYGNPGIAKNYDYNAVFLGSSMVENACVAELDTSFGCKTVKLPYSGGSSYNHKHILDVCYRSDNDIDLVFWALDEYAFTTDVNTPRYPLPEYLYDENRINDLSYLLNLDIFYFYTLKSAIGTFQNQHQILMRDGSPTSDESMYNIASALASTSYPQAAQDSKGREYYAKTLYDNLKHNVLPFVEEHPETEFYFYMVPYSISYWYMCKQSGKLEAEIEIIRTLAETLLQYDNVNFFFFQDETDIITDLSNYRDHTHFRPSINSYMSAQMIKHENQLHKENYQQRIEAFYQYLSNFDYDAFYAEQYALIQ